MPRSRWAAGVAAPAAAAAPRNLEVCTAVERAYTMNTPLTQSFAPAGVRQAQLILAGEVDRLTS